MTMWLTRGVISVALAALALAGVANADSAGPALPPGWSHASVNVVGPRGQAHTVVYDRGVVTTVGALAVTLKELDGSLVTIPLAPNAVVVVGGQSGSLGQIQPGFTATTVCVDGAPARSVNATPPRTPPTLTQGRVVSVSGSSLTLKQRGGSLVTVAVAPDARVVVNGAPAQLSQIRPGFSATAASISGQPAVRVQSSGRAATPAP